MVRRIRLSGDDIPAVSAARIRDELARAESLSVGSVTVEISDRARSLLVGLLGELAAGNRVDVMSVSDMLTTQEAADLLHVSRPTLVKMLDDGVLPYERPGVHRRVPRAAIEDFVASRRERRGAALDEMARTHDADGPDEVVTTR